MRTSSATKLAITCRTFSASSTESMPSEREEMRRARMRSAYASSCKPIVLRACGLHAHKRRRVGGWRMATSRPLSTPPRKLGTTRYSDGLAVWSYLNPSRTAQARSAYRGSSEVSRLEKSTAAIHSPPRRCDGAIALFVAHGRMRLPRLVQSRKRAMVTTACRTYPILYHRSP